MEIPGADLEQKAAQRIDRLIDVLPLPESCSQQDAVARSLRSFVEFEERESRQITARLLRRLTPGGLAVTGSLKPVHFVSTLSVFHTGHHDDGTIFAEEDELEQVGVPFGGYAQSKWVAEKMVMTAVQRGIPAAIYRPGLVSGDSSTGAWNTADMMTTLARASLAIGAVPELDVQVDIVPVNYVSQAIVALSKRPESVSGIFHLANTGHIPPCPKCHKTLFRKSY